MKEVQPLSPQTCKTQRCRTSLHLISPFLHPPPRPNGTRTKTSAALGSGCQHTLGPMLLPGPYSSYRERPHKRMSLGPLLSFDYITLGLGKGKLSFKLTFLKEKEKLRKGFFLIFHGFFSGPPPIQSLSWVFWGAMPLPYPVLFPEFPRLDSSTLSHHFGSNCTCPILLCCHLASTVHGPNKGMSPPAVSLPPVIPDSSPPGRLESSCFCPLWDEVPSVEDTAVPWGFCEAVVS